MGWALELDDVTGEYSNGQVYPLINSVKTTMSGYRNSGSTTSASGTTSTTTLATTSSTTSTTTLATTSSTTSTTNPVTSSSTTSSSCLNVKSTAECETANQVWNMCANAGSWWTTQQCARTCNRC